MLHLVSRQVEILVFFDDFPYLLYTVRKTRGWNNILPIASQASWRDGVEKKLPKLSNLNEQHTKPRHVKITSDR